MLKYVLVVALHHERILNNLQRISKNEPSAGQYIWRKKKFPAKSKDWEKTEKNNAHDTFNICFINNPDGNVLETKQEYKYNLKIKKRGTLQKILNEGKFN